MTAFQVIDYIFSLEYRKMLLLNMTKFTKNKELYRYTFEIVIIFPVICH